MPTPFRLLAPIVIAAFVLAGCGNDDGDGDATPTDPTPTEETTSEPEVTTGDTSAESQSTTTTTSAPGDPTTTAAGGGTVEGCQDLGGGVYQVADAGEVEIRHEGDSVELVEARPAEGWTATGDTEDDDDEVEVTFSSEGREIDFDAEVDDGRLEIGDCDD